MLVAGIVVVVGVPDVVELADMFVVEFAELVDVELTELAELDDVELEGNAVVDTLVVLETSVVVELAVDVVFKDTVVLEIWVTVVEEEGCWIVVVFVVAVAIVEEFVREDGESEALAIVDIELEEAIDELVVLVGTFVVVNNVDCDDEGEVAIVVLVDWIGEDEGAVVVDKDKEADDEEEAKDEDEDEEADADEDEDEEETDEDMDEDEEADDDDEAKDEEEEADEDGEETGDDIDEVADEFEDVEIELEVDDGDKLEEEIELDEGIVVVLLFGVEVVTIVVKVAFIVVVDESAVIFESLFRVKGIWVVVDGAIVKVTFDDKVMGDVALVAGCVVLVEEAVKSAVVKSGEADDDDNDEVEEEELNVELLLIVAVGAIVVVSLLVFIPGVVMAWAVVAWGALLVASCAPKFAMNANKKTRRIFQWKHLFRSKIIPFFDITVCVVVVVVFVVNFFFFYKI